MSKEEYLRKRQAELENPQLKDAHERAVNRSNTDIGTILIAVGVGVVIGWVLFEGVESRVENKNVLQISF